MTLNIGSHFPSFPRWLCRKIASTLMVDDLVYPFFQIIVGAFSHFQERARQQFERAQDVANGRLGRHGTMEAWRFFFLFNGLV